MSSEVALSTVTTAGVALVAAVLVFIGVVENAAASLREATSFSLESSDLQDTMNTLRRRTSLVVNVTAVTAGSSLIALTAGWEWFRWPSTCALLVSVALTVTLVSRAFELVTYTRK